MAGSRSDLTDEIPEADRLEQGAVADPDEDDEVSVERMDAGADDASANPADRQEQLTPVGDDDEEYPHS